MGMFAAGPTVPAYEPPKREFLDKLGLVADAFSGNDMNARQLAARDAEAYAMWREATAPARQMAEWEMRRQWEVDHPSPRYFEANNGDQYRIGANGQPEKLFTDPTPKTTWQAIDNGDGTKQLVPFVNGMPVAQAPAAPVTQLPQGFTVRKKGAAGPGPQTFR